MKSLSRLASPLGCGAAMLVCIAAPSRALELRLDPDSSRVEYRIGHTLGPVQNTAGLPAGSVQAETLAAPWGLRAQVTVDLRRLKTGVDARDHHIKSKEYLDVEHDSLATFTLGSLAPDSSAAAATPAGGWHGIAHGTLELHAVTREVAIPVTLEPAAGRLRVHGTFRVTLADYAIKRPKKLMFSADPFTDVKLNLLFVP